VDRANAELANDLGNLLQRCLSMAAKHNGGRLSAGAGGAGGAGGHTLQEEDIALLEEAGALLEVVRKKGSITYMIILVKAGA
jgi:methionyl-tRNA synthetase